MTFCHDVISHTTRLRIDLKSKHEQIYCYTVIRRSRPCLPFPFCLYQCMRVLLVLCPCWSPRAHLHVGGDVAVHVFVINQPSLPSPFHLFLCLYIISVFMALSTVFHSINPPDYSAFSICSSGLIYALLVLSTTYLFIKVSLSPDIILCGSMGSEHQLTN